MATSALSSAIASRRSAAMAGRSESVVRRTADVLHQFSGFPRVEPGAAARGECSQAAVRRMFPVAPACRRHGSFRKASSSRRSWSLSVGGGLSSSDKAFLEVPLQVFRVGVVGGALGHHGQWLVVQFVVGLAIEPLVLDLDAHAHP